MKKLVLLSALLLTSLPFVNAEDFVFEQGKRSATDIKEDALRKAPQIMELVKLEKGMVVADILGGGGYYAELISAKIGTKGTVYLHNNQAYMPWIEKELVARLQNNRLPNVKRWDREVDNMQWPENGIDAAFFVLGYHDLYHHSKDWQVDKEDFLKQVIQSLKKGAQLLIVDHSALAGTGTKASQDLHRIEKQYVIDELQSKGFKLVKESDLLKNPADTRLNSPFDPGMRRKTDRFILVFEKL